MRVEHALALVKNLEKEEKQESKNKSTLCYKQASFSQHLYNTEQETLLSSRSSLWSWVHFDIAPVRL